MPGKTWNTWNRLPDRPVVPGVGKRRAIGAALAAVGVVLSGCGTADGDDTTTTTPTTSVAEQSDSPWDLPLEQRPALFDPCAEIPVEAIEQGLGGPVTPVPEYTSHKPGELMSCGWRSEDADLSVLSTWKTREEYLADRSFDVANPQQELAGREGMRLLDAIGDPEESCLQLFFTERGTTWIQINLNGLLNEFNSQRVQNACQVFEQISLPIVAYIPKGDFQ
ncbi:DUF3558 family protein [Dietzia aerolata]|uniref:DUF3558 family protein n=1 Tax=Dietzia aerolata TaxID=595984 RepID=A0ABV5JKT8_9ACTN|nr:DUF3558 family protein [Dietzia aerolata]MBB0968956.1 DUF3558 family protein [Dietzia aerolata]